MADRGERVGSGSKGTLAQGVRGGPVHHQRQYTDRFNFVNYSNTFDEHDGVIR